VKSPLNSSTGEPLHIQVEQWLRELIEKPIYQEGAFLPDEVTLSRQLQVSRNTLRTAFTRLVSEGLVERKPRAGTRVINRPVRTGLMHWQSFSQEMADKGLRVETFDLRTETMQAPPQVAQALRLEPGASVFCLRRLRGCNGDPTVLFESWLHPRLVLTDTGDFTRPLYELLEEQCGTIPERSEEEISAIPASRELAALLRIRTGEPLLRRMRLVFDATDPIEYAINHYRADCFTYGIEVRRRER